MESQTKDNVSTIKINENFNFSCQAEFRQTYEKIPKSNRFVLDFSKTSYIDSAALGMLLLLKEYAGGDGSKIEIIKCKPEVQNIFQISNFGQLFKIS